MDWAAIALLAALAAISVRLGILDTIGALAAFILGAVVVFAGAPAWVILMVAFTGLGFVATRYGRREKEARRLLEEDDGRRGLANVIANGLAPALAAVAALFLPHDAAALAFATAVAAVTADTLASEVGSLAPRVRRILPPFDLGKPGRNGYVSRRGQGAAAAGAVAIAALAAVLGIIPWLHAWVPALGGFVGCQLDSILGATLESDDPGEPRPLSKQDVNFVASAVPAFVVLVTATLL